MDLYGDGNPSRSMKRALGAFMSIKCTRTTKERKDKPTSTLSYLLMSRQITRCTLATNCI